MIVEWFFGLGDGLSGWFFSMIPAPANEAALIVSTDNLFTPFASGMSSLGAWLPWGVLSVTVPVVMSIYLVSLFARALRVVLGHIPLIGGNG